MDIVDRDPTETREWVDAAESVLKTEGPIRLAYLLDRMLGKARHWGAVVPARITTRITSHMTARTFASISSANIRNCSTWLRT